MAAVVFASELASAQVTSQFADSPDMTPQAATASPFPMNPGEQGAGAGVGAADMSVAQDAWKGWTDPGVEFLCQPPRPDYWMLDYRCRAFFSSYTAYQYGTEPQQVPGWSPLSRLNFALNSCWHGLVFGKETPTESFTIEWMMAGQYIQGRLRDEDWVPPNPDGSFTDLGFARERWEEGQMLDIGYKRRIFDHPLGLPVEVWPMIGFRWQRFNITAYDGEQVKSGNEWLNPPDLLPGDVINFNQQYYMGYTGAQFRGRIEPKLGILPTLLWTLQGDWGYTEAYNIDHHLLREGNMYTMNRTHGDSWHVAMTLEALVTNRVSFGVQADHLQIATTGRHRWFNEPLGINESWGTGVQVWSKQNWITAFLRVRM